MQPNNHVQITAFLKINFGLNAIYVLSRQNFKKKWKLATHTAIILGLEFQVYLQSGTISSSISRVHKDHSICNAVMGCTAWARLIVSELASDNPMYFTFPSSTNFLSSRIYHTHKTPKIENKKWNPPMH